jgi:hypothetical protein
VKRSLRNFGKNNGPTDAHDTPKDNGQNSSQNSGQNTNAGPMAGIDANTMNMFQMIMNQYGGKSDYELINELRRLQQMGMLDIRSLYDIANRIAPMLSPQQLERLSQIIQELSN